jgi:hypothetical protein
MAARLQLKLGIVAEHDRLDDSPDTLVVVEPSVGSVARSKGNLYLLVTSRTSSRHALEATRLAAETIRNEYYYDESAGIRVCLQKAIATANKRLIHQADRLGLKATDDNGPIGVGVAVVRGNEMYVATVGPSEAYLIRQARLSTLPDPHRERGLPSNGLEPDVWRGEITVGDSLVLISPNIVAKLGPDELKDAMVTLHPQSAMEHLHQRFRSAEGSGSDGAVAFEATEVAPTTRGRTLVPVRPAEPLAGAPDRSPIPLADNVQAAGAAVSAAADSAREGLGSAAQRAVLRLQDVLPRRRPAYRRVTPLASRRETQRRAAIALIALLVVVGGLAMSVWAFGGQRQQQAISSVNAGRDALDKAKADLALVSGPGIDLITDDRDEALRLLTEAYSQLDKAKAAKISDREINPVRAAVVTGLDRLFDMLDVTSTDLFRFKPAEGAPPFDLRTMVLGPDKVPYVIDTATKSVYRIDLRRKRAVVVARSGRRFGSTRMSDPKFLAVGGRDLVIVDAKNVVWRWRASNDAGKGTTNRMTVNGSTQWGNDIRAVGTYVRPNTNGLYNLYVVDPSEQQIRIYPPASDGGGFPARFSPWLDAARPLDKVTSLYIDGDLYLATDGAVERFTSGQNVDWTPKAPGDSILRPEPAITIIAGAGEKNKGRIYAYDAENARVLAWEQADGTFVGQYRLADGDVEGEGWKDLRAMYVIPGVEEAPATLVWLSASGVHQAVLAAAEEEPTTPGASGSPRPSGGAPSGSAAASPSR